MVRSFNSLIGFELELTLQLLSLSQYVRIYIWYLSGDNDLRRRTREARSRTRRLFLFPLSSFLGSFIRDVPIAEVRANSRTTKPCTRSSKLRLNLLLHNFTFPSSVVSLRSPQVDSLALVGIYNRSIFPHPFSFHPPSSHLHFVQLIGFQLSRTDITLPLLSRLACTDPAEVSIQNLTLCSCITIQEVSRSSQTAHALTLLLH